MKRSFRHFALAFAIAASILGVSTASASAKQCVYNKSGFLLRVTWYEPTAFRKYMAAKAKRQRAYKPRPMQTDVFPLLQGRCTRGRAARHRLIAVLSMEGKAFFESGFRELVKLVRNVGRAVMAPWGLQDVAFVPYLADAILKLPHGKEVFKIMYPSTTRYVDVWGTAFSPQAANVGGRI